MSEQPLTIVTNPPSVIGGHYNFGSLDLNILKVAMDDARTISSESGTVPSDSVEVRELKGQIQALADTVTELAGQLYQIGVAVKSGRISVVPLES